MLQHILKPCKIFLASLVVLVFAVGAAQAVEYSLCADDTLMTMPDGQQVTVWGFGLDTGGACAVTVPGPTLRVDSADPVLTVNLRNLLTEPVSLHILGQSLTNNGGPVWDGGAAGPRPGIGVRVRSFTHEAAGNGGTASYTWGSVSSPLKPGTYLVQSGTNPAKQVQMGLFAPVVKDTALSTAYPSVPYTKELILVFHEIDPAIHAAVAAGTYGPGGTITSSVYREPAYFLINGMGYPAAGLNPVNAATPVNQGERVLIRFINGGLETHVPEIMGEYMTLVAEDGVPYTYGKEQSGIELNSAKTVDAIFVPPSTARFSIYDARLRLANAGVSPGGMLASLNAGAAAADTVTISSVAYDALAQTFTVSASSSTQPSVTLSAQGFGPLDWKSWLNLYRNTFTNVTTRPAAVTVASSGGGVAQYLLQPADAVAISSVSYDATAQTLTVAATSSNQPNVSLNAQGYGALGWKSWLNVYRTTFSPVATRPSAVTVTSSAGGSVTYALPAVDTVTVTSAVYSADAGGTLTVVATSSNQPNVALTAQGYGALGWKSWLNLYRTTFTGIGANPGTVSVTSSGGGSAIQAVP